MLSVHLGIPNSQHSVCRIHTAQWLVTMVTVVSIVTTNYVVNILTWSTWLLVIPNLQAHTSATFLLPIVRNLKLRVWIYLILHNIVCIHLPNLIRILPVVLWNMPMDTRGRTQTEGRTRRHNDFYMCCVTTHNFSHTVIINRTVYAYLHRRHNGLNPCLWRPLGKHWTFLCCFSLSRIKGHIMWGTENRDVDRWRGNSLHA
jgi:hypothetical protein